MNSILIEKYRTTLGLVDFSLISNSNFKVTSKAHFVTEIKTDAHQINIRSGEIFNFELSEFLKVESLKFWIVNILKVNPNPHSLGINVALLNPGSALKWNTDEGERLCAIEILSADRQMHIGTEEHDDLDPKFGLSKVVDFGLLTKIPELKEFEEIKLHYIIAENPIQKSVQYPKERDESTWYCVGQSFNSLETLFHSVNSR